MDRIDRQLPHERPLRPVDRKKLAAMNRRALQHRQEEKLQAEPDADRLTGHGRDDQTRQHPAEDRRIEPRQPDPHIAAPAHVGQQPLLIGLRNDEAAEHEEEIHRHAGLLQIEIEAAQILEMAPHHRQRRHAAKTVQRGEVFAHGGRLSRNVRVRKPDGAGHSSPAPPSSPAASAGDPFGEALQWPCARTATHRASLNGWPGLTPGHDGGLGAASGAPF